MWIEYFFTWFHCFFLFLRRENCLNSFQIDYTNISLTHSLWIVFPKHRLESIMSRWDTLHFPLLLILWIVLITTKWLHSKKIENPPTLPKIFFTTHFEFFPWKWDVDISTDSIGWNRFVNVKIIYFKSKRKTLLTSSFWEQITVNVKYHEKNAISASIHSVLEQGTLVCS